MRKSLIKKYKLSFKNFNNFIRIAIKKISNLNKFSLRKLINLIKNNLLFNFHEKIVILIFNPVIKPYIDFKLSDETLYSINEYLDHLFQNCSKYNEKEFLNNLYVEGLKSSPLLLNENNVEGLLKCCHSNVVLDPFHPATLKLHKEIKSHIKKYVNSPFSIVNSRAWKTYPNSDIWGPNTEHVDMFEAGHLKIMIYPNGLNGKNGAFYLESFGKISNAPLGYGICFKNSDIFHCGIPGDREDRVSIEITIQRTLTYLPQLNKSHFHGRHLKNPFDIYIYASNYLK